MTEQKCKCDLRIGGCTCGAIVPYRIKSQGQWAIDKWRRELEPEAITVEATPSIPASNREAVKKAMTYGPSHHVPRPSLPPSQYHGPASPLARTQGCTLIPPDKNIIRLTELMAKHDDAEAMVRFMAHLSDSQSVELAAVACTYFVEIGGNLMLLVREARRLRGDPSVRGFLALLKAILCNTQVATEELRRHRLLETGDESAWEWLNWTEQQKENGRRHQERYGWYGELKKAETP